MMMRWRHFSVNAGRGGVIKTAILHAAILAITTLATLDGTGWSLPLVALVAWSLPALLRSMLTVSPEKTQKVLNIAAMIIMAGAFAAGFVREHLDDDILLHVVIATLSTYCSAYWWLLSDPAVVRIRPRPPS